MLLVVDGERPGEAEQEYGQTRVEHHAGVQGEARTGAVALDRVVEADDAQRPQQGQGEHHGVEQMAADEAEPLPAQAPAHRVVDREDRPRGQREHEAGRAPGRGRPWARTRTAYAARKSRDATASGASARRSQRDSAPSGAGCHRSSPQPGRGRPGVRPGDTLRTGEVICCTA
ncbi:hypothetical protein SMD44_01572 [Streptomyces alboflavus]|uniref:Uncharacterized protein n=1 Tax=Streptomyces alboflavus TaxID=67267 RepID=A0A1Z1W6V4_9ACTN|nr:hypothetical protein SMD44_01572 [Streptomyces alboflavus]